MAEAVPDYKGICSAPQSKRFCAIRVRQQMLEYQAYSPLTMQIYETDLIPLNNESNCQPPSSALPHYHIVTNASIWKLCDGTLPWNSERNGSSEAPLVGNGKG